MDVSLGPAELGGLMLCVGLAGWALGRWQGGLAAPENRVAPPRSDAAVAAAGTSCEAGSPPANPGRPVVAPKGVPLPAEADSLVALHAEISAYRRAEQVLAEMESDAVLLRALPRVMQDAPRRDGELAAPACIFGDEGAPDNAGAGVQPSPAPAARLRL